MTKDEIKNAFMDLLALFLLFFMLMGLSKFFYGALNLRPIAAVFASNYCLMHHFLATSVSFFISFRILNYNGISGSDD